MDARGVELLRGDVAVLVEVCSQAVAVPRHCRHVRRLREEVGTDLVAQHTHHRRGRSDERDLTTGSIHALLEEAAKLRVVGGVAPADHDRIHVLGEAQVDNELQVGIVVGATAARNLDELVSAADELRVGGNVLGRGHDDELDRVLVTKGLVCPAADRHDRLGRSHAVVGDQNASDELVAAALAHVRPHSLLESRPHRSLSRDCSTHLSTYK